MSESVESPITNTDKKDLRGEIDALVQQFAADIKGAIADPLKHPIIAGVRDLLTRDQAPDMIVLIGSHAAKNIDGTRHYTPDEQKALLNYAQQYADAQKTIEQHRTKSHTYRLMPPTYLDKYFRPLAGLYAQKTPTLDDLFPGQYGFQNIYKEESPERIGRIIARNRMLGEIRNAAEPQPTK